MRLLGRTIRVLAASTLLGSTALLGGGAAAEASPDACAPTIFYGVRGTTESQQELLGLGGTLYETYRALDALVGSVRAESATYPASFFPYDRSVRKGIDATVADVTRLATRCAPEGTTFVIAGYSQGAEVVRGALPLIDSAVLPHATVLLFGDPNFSPEEQFVSKTSRVELTGAFQPSSGQPASGRQSSGQPASGQPAREGDRAQAAPLPFDTSRWSLYSYCHAKDVVCDHRGGGASHSTYITIDARAAAARAAEAYYGPRRPTRLPAPLAQINGVFCGPGGADGRARQPTASVTLSMQQSPPDSSTTYDLLLGKEQQVLDQVELTGQQIAASVPVFMPPGVQLLTVRATTTYDDVEFSEQVAQRYLSLPVC